MSSRLRITWRRTLALLVIMAGGIFIAEAYLHVRCIGYARWRFQRNSSIRNLDAMISATGGLRRPNYNWLEESNALRECTNVHTLEYAVYRIGHYAQPSIDRFLLGVALNTNCSVFSRERAVRHICDHGNRKIMAELSATMARFDKNDDFYLRTWWRVEDALATTQQTNAWSGGSSRPDNGWK